MSCASLGGWKLSVATVAALALAACGGGGESGSSGASGPAPAAARAWGSAQPIETTDLGHAFAPQVAIHASGHAVAVWYQFTSSGRSDIWANRYTPATGWGTAERIETDDAGPANDVQLAMDASGNAIAVWRQHDGTRHNNWANRYDAAAGRWGTAEPIETDDAGNASSPRVALDPAGNAIAVWHQFDGMRNNIWANRYDAALGRWESAQIIEVADGDAVQPDVGIDATGSAWAIWSQFDGVEFSVYANRYADDAAIGTGSWGTAALIESSVGDTGYARVAVHASGSALAVWGQFDGSRYRLWARHYDAASGWEPAQAVENGDGIDAPQIEMDANGNGVAIWTNYASAQDEIWVNRFSGGAWGAAEMLSSTSGDAGAPQVAFDSFGNAIAVWHQHDGMRDNIWARHFDIAAATWGTPASLEIDPGQADSAGIAVDAEGRAIAVWNQRAGAASFNINASVYR